jgi:hypothetical protein
MRGQSAREQNECDNYQPDQYADQKTEYDRELIFAISELFSPSAED